MGSCGLLPWDFWETAASRVGAAVAVTLKESPQGWPSQRVKRELQGRKRNRPSQGSGLTQGSAARRVSVVQTELRRCDGQGAHGQACPRVVLWKEEEDEEAGEESAAETALQGWEK